MGLVACFVIIDQCLKAYGSHYQSTLDFCQYEHILSCFFLSFLYSDLSTYQFVLGQGLFILILDQNET